MSAIVEIDRRPSTSKEPHSIATDGRTVWIASRATRCVDTIDRAAWRKVDELQPPGMAWGMTYAGGDLLVTCGEGPDDDRRIYTYRNGSLIGRSIRCPNDTGSHLAFTGKDVLLGQWYRKKVHVLGADGWVSRTFDTPHEVCGLAFKDGGVYVLGTDDENTSCYYLSVVDLDTGEFRDIAEVPFRARGLAWDGAAFWANHREADQTVTFALPA